MAFIVEMMYTPPHQKITYGDTCKDGTHEILEVKFLPENYGKVYRYMECSMWMWNDLLLIAKQFGWAQSGTILEKFEDYKFQEKLNRFNSMPSSYGEDLKLITTTDAANFANALEKALPIVEVGNLVLKKHPKLVQEGLEPQIQIKIIEGITSDFLKEVIEFLRQGQLIFVYDD